MHSIIDGVVGRVQSWSNRSTSEMRSTPR